MIKRSFIPLLLLIMTAVLATPDIKNQNFVSREGNDVTKTDSALSNELKKRLGLLTDRNDNLESGQTTTIPIAANGAYGQHGSLDDLGDAYKQQI